MVRVCGEGECGGGEGRGLWVMWKGVEGNKGGRRGEVRRGVSVVGKGRDWRERR